MQKVLATLAIAAVIASLALSCAPASDQAGMGMDGMAPGGGDIDLKIGETAPPFAMTLADGTEVSSESLTASGRPAHLFWFATW